MLPFKVAIPEHLLSRYLVDITDHLKLLLFAFNFVEQLPNSLVPLVARKFTVLVSALAGVEEQLLSSRDLVLVGGDAHHPRLHDLPGVEGTSGVAEDLLGGGDAHLVLEAFAAGAGAGTRASDRGHRIPWSWVGAGGTLGPCLGYLTLKLIACNFKFHYYSKKSRLNLEFIFKIEFKKLINPIILK